MVNSRIVTGMLPASEPSQFRLPSAVAPEKPPPPAKASGSATRPAEPRTTPSAVPPGFFDGDSGKAGTSASKRAETEAMHLDSRQDRSVDQQKQKDPGQKGVLPKGFFDDKEKDHKARGEEAPKLDIK